MNVIFYLLGNYSKTNAEKNNQSLPQNKNISFLSKIIFKCGRLRPKMPSKFFLNTYFRSKNNNMKKYFLRNRFSITPNEYALKH